MRRRAFSLTEVTMVVLLVGLLSGVCWRAWHLLARRERAVDREATRAILESQLLEQMLMDLRSAVSLKTVSPGVFDVQRMVAGAPCAALTATTVRWTFGKDRAERREGPHVTEYNFGPYLTAEEPVLKLRLERIEGDDIPPWVAGN